MIAVHRTHQGWTLRQNEDQLGYYSSIPEVKSVTYAEECEADHYGDAEQRNSSSNYRRSAKGS